MAFRLSICLKALCRAISKCICKIKHGKTTDWLGNFGLQQPGDLSGIGGWSFDDHSSKPSEVFYRLTSQNRPADRITTLRAVPLVYAGRLFKHWGQTYGDDGSFTHQMDARPNAIMDVFLHKVVHSHSVGKFLSFWRRL